MINTFNPSPTELISNLSYQTGRQYQQESIPSRHTKSSSPTKNLCPPNMVNSLKCLQKIFQQEQQAFQSIQQQLNSSRKFVSLSPSMSQNYPSSAPMGSQSTTNQQSSCQQITQPPIQQLKPKKSSIQQGSMIEFKRNTAESIYQRQEISGRKIMNDMGNHQQNIFFTQHALIDSNRSKYSQQIDSTKNSYKTLHSTPIKTKENIDPDSKEIWMQRYFALQESQSHQILDLTNQLKESQAQVALSTKNSHSQIDKRFASQSRSETKSLFEESAQLQTDRALLIQKNNEKDNLISSYLVTIKKMDGQLSSYQSALKNLQSVNNRERENGLKISNHNKAQLITQQQQQIQIQKLIQAQSLIESVLTLVKMPTINHKSQNHLPTCIELSVSTIPIDNSMHLSCSEHVAVNDLKMTLGQNVNYLLKRNEFSQQKSGRNETTDQHINLSQVIKDSLLKRSDKK